MAEVNFKGTTQGSLNEVIERLTAALQAEGFGILTRIDLHQKLKEKLDKDIPPTVILGACNPGLAFEAFSLNPDVASLLPCNAVVQELGPNHISIQLAKPSVLMEFLADPQLVAMAKDADMKLQRALEKMIAK